MYTTRITALLCGACLLFPAVSLSQPSLVSFLEDDEVLRDSCAVDSGSAQGNALPDGTPIYIIWDVDRDGYDEDSDVLVPQYTEWNPPPPPYGNFNTFFINGEAEMGTPGQFFTPNSWAWTGLGTLDHFYLKVPVEGDWWLISDVVVVYSGQQYVYTSGWTCQHGSLPCSPVAPLWVLATDTDCDAAIVTWAHSDTLLSYSGFRVFRDGLTLDDVSYETREYIDSTAPRGFHEDYEVSALAECPGGILPSFRRGDIGGIGLAQPPTQVECSREFCDRIVVTWAHEDTELDYLGFSVRLYGWLFLAYIPYDSPWVFVDLTAEPGQLLPYYVTALAHCYGDTTGSVPAAESGSRGAVRPIFGDATDNLCDSVVVDFLDWEGNSADSFLVYRDSVRIGGIPSMENLRHYVFVDRTPIPGWAWYSATSWSSECGETPQSSGDWGGTCLGVSGQVSVAEPEKIALLPAYPNPFNATVTIALEVTARTSATLVVFDILGREVKTLLDGAIEPGLQRFAWSPQTGSGVYLVRLKVSDGTKLTQKILHLK